MKITYVDSSILVGILFSEKKATQWRQYLNGRDDIMSSSLIEAELFSAAARESCELKRVEELLDGISLILPDRSLRPEYQNIFSSGYGRGADVYHLACALYLDPDAKEIEFFTADIPQGELAKRLGFKVKEG